MFLFDIKVKNSLLLVYFSTKTLKTWLPGGHHFTFSRISAWQKALSPCRLWCEITRLFSVKPLLTKDGFFFKHHQLSHILPVRNSFFFNLFLLWICLCVFECACTHVCMQLFACVHVRRVHICACTQRLKSGSCAVPQEPFITFFETWSLFGT